MSIPLTSALIAPCTRAAQPLPSLVPVGAIVPISDENNVVEQSNGSAWIPYTNSLIQTATTILTNAQIKALGAGTAVALQSAPGAGIGIPPLWIDLILDATAGAYTNINTTDSSLVVTLGSRYYSTFLSNYSADSIAMLSGFLGTAGIQFARLFPVMVNSAGYGEPLAESRAAADWLNVGSAIVGSNNSAGPFATGNVANTLKVIQYWIPIVL